MGDENYYRGPAENVLAAPAPDFEAADPVLRVRPRQIPSLAAKAKANTGAKEENKIAAMEMSDVRMDAMKESLEKGKKDKTKWFALLYWIFCIYFLLTFIGLAVVAVAAALGLK